MPASSERRLQFLDLDLLDGLPLDGRYSAAGPADSPCWERSSHPTAPADEAA